MIIQDREQFPEIISISKRVEGVAFTIKIPDHKQTQGYDLVDVLVHHNGMRSLKSANLSRTTPHKASQIVTKYLSHTTR